MKYTTRMIGTVVAFCMAVPVFAQQYKATIPYRMVGDYRNESERHGTSFHF